MIVEKIIEEMKKDIEGLENEAYLSEADFQFAFARKAEELGAKRVIVEYPYTFKKDRVRKHIDVFFEYEDEEYYVELKYKTKYFGTATRLGKDEFVLSNQAAINDAMFYFRKDIERLERLLEEKNGDKVNAYCVFLTNNHLVWEPHKECRVANVQLCDSIKPGLVKYKKDKEFDISNSNQLDWHDFKNLGKDQEMRYLIVKCKSK